MFYHKELLDNMQALFCLHDSLKDMIVLCRTACSALNATRCDITGNSLRESNSSIFSDRNFTRALHPQNFPDPYGEVTDVADTSEKNKVVSVNNIDLGGRLSLEATDQPVGLRLGHPAIGSYSSSVALAS